MLGVDDNKLSKIERSSMSSTRDEEWIVQVHTDMAPGPGGWVSKVNDQLTKITETRSTESNRWKKQSIYRIPQSVKELRSTAYRLSIGPYEPQTVSIGPYHHGKQQVESMEEHKQRALLTFLDRSKKPLSCYVDALAPVLEDLKDAYHQLDPKWKQDTEAFMQLMIVDGCFILEMMRATTAKTTDELKLMGYADNDPVFSSHGKLYLVPYLKRDMLMLENQLPLTLLQRLVVAEQGIPTHDAFSKLNLLILDFFSLLYDRDNIEEYKKCLHILDLYRRSMLMRLSCQKPKQKEICDDCLPGGSLKNADAYIRTATELKEAGIRIEQSKTCNLNDISFKGGVLRLPLIVVDDTLESQYLNMMALERFHVDAGNEVTSFVFFMDSIIDSAKDVGLLHSCGIIQNALGSDKAVAQLFNSLSRDVTLDPEGRLGVVHKQVAEYCHMLLPRWLAYAKHTYFTNPWVGLSILAAMFLFALAGIQTAYTVLGYYHST